MIRAFQKMPPICPHGYRSFCGTCEADIERLIARKETERADIIAALRLAAENYGRCLCGAPAAEWWLERQPNPGGELALLPLCGPCAVKNGVTDECVPAEPADHIAAIAKVRHLIWERANDSAVPNGSNVPESPDGSTKEG